jgi:hypothetical protein
MGGSLGIGQARATVFSALWPDLGVIGTNSESAKRASSAGTRFRFGRYHWSSGDFGASKRGLMRVRPSPAASGCATLEYLSTSQNGF